MTQANESLGLTASQHIEKIYEHTGQAIFDYAVVNTAPVSEALLRNYAREGATPIVPDIERIEALGVRVIPGNFAAEGDTLRVPQPASQIGGLDRIRREQIHGGVKSHLVQRVRYGLVIRTAETLLHLGLDADLDAIRNVNA